MVDAPRLRSLLERLESRCVGLEQYAVLSADAYLADEERMNASKYLLLTAIEDALSVANHVISVEGFRAPKEYADAFRSLAEAGVLGEDLSERLQAMARFRNLLVHVYEDVDDRRVHDYLRRDVGDLREFAKSLLKRFPDLEIESGT